MKGKAAPTFKRRTLAGTDIDTKDLAGKVVLIKFFARYCEPCKRTLPVAERLAKTKNGLAVIGVDGDEQASEAMDVVNTYALSFPVVHDPGHVLSGRYRVTDLPMSFVIGRHADVVAVLGPEAPEGALEAAIDSALSGKE